MNDFNDKLANLSKEDWQRVKKIFSQLTQQDPRPDPATAEQQLYKLCQDAPHIVPVLQQMLSVYLNSPDKTITPQQSAVSMISEQTLLKPGDVFGKYQITKLIGSGGMGQVYQASRKGEIHQEVAIKILNANLLDEQAKARFDTERRVMASLEHPHIARLIDTGTEQGHPYYVMEYIDGTAIDLYCKEHQLGLRDRLQLFLKIAAAVSFAHSHLIVHRDLKPGNILVNAQGEVKLLDFGIAKPLKLLPGTESLHETMVGTTALTPQYAAPEQINGETIGVACDTYVLGLLLYQLLTDEHAFDLSNKTWGEIEAVINHQLPTLPSKLLRKSQPQHQSSAHSWSGKLKGDLDAIVSHALKKEPQQRYASVQDMSSDIKRYLNHEPILIKQSQTIYRLKKHIRKHWLPITALSLIFSVMLVSTVLIWQQANTIKTERDKAITEKQVAEQVTQFLVDTFKSADPTQTLGAKLTAGDILYEGVKQLESQNPNPQIKNRLLSTLAEVYMNLSEYDLADKLIDQVDINALEDLSNKFNLEYVKATILSERGKMNEALSIIEKIEKNITGNDDRYFKVMNFKANLLRSTDSFIDSIALSKNLLLKAKDQFGADSFIYAIQLRNHARQMRSVEKRTMIIQMYNDSINIMNDITDLPDRTELLETMRRLMVELTNDQQYDKALELSNKLESEYLKIYPEKHIIYGPLFTSRGMIYVNTNRPEESLLNHQKSNQIYTKLLGKESTNVAFTEVNMAVVYLYKIGDYNQAKEYFESALDKIKQNSGKKNNYHYVLLPYVTCLIKLNQYDDAKSIIVESIKYYQERKVKAPSNLNLALSLMAHIMIHEGDYESGNDMLQKSLPSVMENYGDTLHKQMIESDLLIVSKYLGEKDGK